MHRIVITVKSAASIASIASGAEVISVGWPEALSDKSQLRNAKGPAPALSRTSGAKAKLFECTVL